MIALKMLVVLAASLLSALATGALLRLAGVDVPEAGTLIGSCTGVGGALAANLVRQREAARLRRPAVVPVERGSR
ncbi:MAG: hypothetical protein IT196_03335 [Acidimicrobiales bacterium]|nr:hypothetical protein [Acidimicrobiales bacterium]